MFHDFSANLQAVCTMIDKDTLGKHMQYIETGLRHQILKVKVTRVNLTNQGDHQLHNSPCVYNMKKLPIIIYWTKTSKLSKQ